MKDARTEHEKRCHTTSIVCITRNIQSACKRLVKQGVDGSGNVAWKVQRAAIERLLAPLKKEDDDADDDDDDGADGAQTKKKNALDEDDEEECDRIVEVICLCACVHICSHSCVQWLHDKVFNGASERGCVVFWF